jgi:CheY-like chemotaxis protein
LELCYNAGKERIPLSNNQFGEATYRHGDAMRKVLVIDDNPTIVELIKYAVNLQGRYDVVVAYDGVEGLERIYLEQPDCVIIDVKMPRMDGYELARCLRGDPRTLNVPLIILSAMTREQDQMTGYLSGVDEYLTKPFKPSALNAAIERVLTLTPADRQRRIEQLVQGQTGRE